MRTAPSSPELIERLAAEYVLGTLRGAARHRFERWRESSAAVDARCGYWEEQLLPMLGTLKPLEPSAGVWPRIRMRLALAPEQPRRRGSLTLALAASVLLVLFAALLYMRLEPRTLKTATIAAPSGALLWQVEVSGAHGAAARLSVRAGTLARPQGQDYELWALPKSGNPVSLGVLPYGGSSLTTSLTASQRQALGAAERLAVSIEPPGGSPTGQPTGAVVYVVALHVVS
jgi:anti-sigma-K factor RskA